MGSVEACTEKYPDGLLFTSFCSPELWFSIVFNICSHFPSHNSMLIESIRVEKGRNITKITFKILQKSIFLATHILCQNFSSLDKITIRFKNRFFHPTFLFKFKTNKQKNKSKEAVCLARGKYYCTISIDLFPSQLLTFLLSLG